MKRTLLLVFCALFVVSAISQNKDFQLKSFDAPDNPPTYLPISKFKSTSAEVTPERFSREVNGRYEQFIPIGNSPNVASIYSNSSTFLWANPELNAVAFTHSYYYDSNTLNVSYDLSLDGGINWTSNNYINFNSSGMRAQGGIINPVGNTDPSNAYYSFLSLVNSSGSTGISNSLLGANVLTEFSSPNFSFDTIENEDEFVRNFDDAFTVSQLGVAWSAGGVYSGTTFEYLNKFVIGKGEVIDNEIVYSEQIIDYQLPSGGSFNDVKMAFSPDGQTGFICFMSGEQIIPVPYTNYHPVLFKTINGGVSWTGPINVQLGGVDGIESIVYYWSDEILESIDVYGPGFNRDEVYYNMGFSCDIVVDAYGNPHITGIIAVATDEGWFPNEGTMATWHVYSNDEGTSWNATALYDNIFFDGDVGGVTMYNKPYISRTMDAEEIYFSWIDTDLDGAEGNTNPNIFVCGYCPSLGIYGDIDNVTELSLYWFSAFFGNMSEYVFSGYENGASIPFVFAEFSDPGNPFSEINYWYIYGYSPYWTPCFIGTSSQSEPIAHVSQNFPNPANLITTIVVDTEKKGDIRLEIKNCLGQLVYQERVNTQALAHTYYVNVSNFKPGVYFYSVSQNGKSVTKKMIVN